MNELEVLRIIAEELAGVVACLIVMTLIQAVFLAIFVVIPLLKKD